MYLIPLWIYADQGKISKNIIGADSRNKRFRFLKKGGLGGGIETMCRTSVRFLRGATDRRLRVDCATLVASDP
jgi:hypothetical protein